MSTEPDNDEAIDRVLDRVLRKIEVERKAIEYRCLNPESGETRTERLLIDAMDGRVSLDELEAAVL